MFGSSTEQLGLTPPAPQHLQNFFSFQVHEGLNSHKPAKRRKSTQTDKQDQEKMNEGKMDGAK